MPTWRVDFNHGADEGGLSFTVDSNEIALYPNFDSDMLSYGPRKQIHAERQWLEHMMREEPDPLIGWFLSTKGPGALNTLRLRAGASIIASGIDGEFDTATNEFRTASVALSNARMGKLVEVTAVNDPPLVRGFYRLDTRVTGNRAVVDGVLPINAIDLTFNLREPAEALVVLTDLNPV